MRPWPPRGGFSRPNVAYTRHTHTHFTHTHTHISHTHTLILTHNITHISRVSNSTGGSWGWWRVHEERETGGQAAQGFFAERLSETQQQLSLASAASWSRSARMRAACIRGCRARPPVGGSPPPFCPLMHLFVCFPGPPIAHPLSSGGGFASTLLLTRSRIDTGSRCARTPSPYECSSK